MRDAIEHHASRPGIRRVVLDAEAIPFVDITGIHMLDDVADDLHCTGHQLVLAHDLGQVDDVLTRYPDSWITVPTIDQAITWVRTADGLGPVAP